MFYIALIVALVVALIAVVAWSSHMFAQLARCLFYTTVASVFNRYLTNWAPVDGWTDRNLRTIGKHMTKLCEQEMRKL